MHTLPPVQYPVCHGVLLPLAIGIPALCLQHRDHMAAGHVHAQPLVRLVRAHWLQWTPGTTILVIVKSEIYKIKKLVHPNLKVDNNQLIFFPHLACCGPTLLGS